MYRSWSPDGRDELIRNLLTQFNKDELGQVPGFILNSDGNLSMVGISSGLLVPVRNANGLIVAMKIRRDDTSDGRGKFMSLSGGSGPSCGTPTHVPFGLRGPLHMVRITEGELKADIATDRSAVPTIGIAGVSSWRHSLPVLEALQTNAVRLAFDADYATKTGVASNLASFAQELMSHGYAVSIERWPIENGKGIDDLLIGGHPPELLAGSQATEFVAGLLEDRCTPTETVVSVHAITEVLGAPATNGTENIGPVPVSSPLLPFPVDVFPAPVRLFALQVAESLGCPVDIVAGPILGISATAIGASRALELKPGWSESPRFYIAIVAPPGSGKSPAESLVCRPAYDMQSRFRQEYKQALEAYEEAEELRRPRGRRRPQAADTANTTAQDSPTSSDTTADTTAVVTQDNSTTAASLASRPKPVLLRIIVSDATTESLAPLSAENPRGVIMLKDEMSGWAASMNQYKNGKGTDCQFYLSCWSGSPATIDRKTQGQPIFVPHPFINVMGGIQPDMLSTLCQDKNRADGFLDRILFLYPDHRGASRWVSQGVNPEVQRSWSDTLELLYQ